MKLGSFKDRKMSQLTQLRLAGYTAIISMHITNIYYMDWYRKQIHTDDERILAFRHLGNRFLTTWTFMLQIAYAFFGIVCDVLIMKNTRKHSYTLPMGIGEIRDAIFSAVIWPSSWVVSIIFWGLFNCDRSLIFPEHLDVVLPTVSNHIIHTAIVAIVFFEVLSRPRTEPNSHLKNIGLMTLYISLYLMVMLFTYKEGNVWLCPIFGQLYGSVSFLFLLAAVYALLIVFYCLQWPLSNIIYPQGGVKKRKIQKRKKRD